MKDLVQMLAEVSVQPTTEEYEDMANKKHQQKKYLAENGHPQSLIPTN